MSELHDLFRRNFPFTDRDTATVEHLLNDPAAARIMERDEDGTLIGAAVIAGNNIRMLCVDAAHRRRGIGAKLLSAAEGKIREAGYTDATVGVGNDGLYLTPGVPAHVPIVDEPLMADRVCGGIDPTAAAFFKKRGYIHDRPCNIFDMAFDLAEFSAEADESAGVTYRFAQLSDLPQVLACTNDAYDEFTQYYDNGDLYEEDCSSRILIAADSRGEVVGTLIVNLDESDEKMGSVGCTTVRPTHRGRKIATNMVITGTKFLRDAGMKRAVLGYTYTGLDKMYGCAGYKISVYYFMAKKSL